ncbi:MAG TPA: helix-turn-helix domain-containing protein [Caulobacteraceae bacterium]
MPLDSGTYDDGGVAASDRPAAGIGAIFRATREHQGLSLADVAESTCIRRAYLQGLEEMRLEQLPARPFAIGYVKSYAQALGMDPAAAVARFKEEAPDLAEPLRPPVGVEKKGDRRLGLMVALGVVVLAAIVIWNVAQRAMTSAAPPPLAVPETSKAAFAAPPRTGSVEVAAPKAAPAESTVPEPYVTPGLMESAQTGGESSKGNATGLGALAQVATAPAMSAPPLFIPRGRIYGAPATASSVTLQARKSASLIVSGPEGVVYFAQQLQAGEAYRAPAGLANATMDVSDPLAFDVYVGGQIRAPLPAAQTPLGKVGAAPTLAKTPAR